MKDFELIQLSADDGQEEYEMLQRIERFENDFNNEVKGMTFLEYQEWLKERDSWSRGELLPKGYVKQWIFWLRVDGTPVGIGKLRQTTTAKSKEWGGNIGFAIDSSQRGKGYGTILFEQLLLEAKKLGIKEVLSTVRKNNISSCKVHEKCGGVLIKENKETSYYSFMV